MEVTLNRDYYAAPEGHTVILYRAGDKIHGKVAEMAVSDGAADRPKKRGPKPKHIKPAYPDHEG